MPGTKEGGLNTRETIIERYGRSFWQLNGAKGGRKSNTGGFYKNRPLARAAGRIGGLNRRRSVRTPKQEREYQKALKHLLKVAEKARQEREARHLQAL
jgi:hypothetical protein